MKIAFASDIHLEFGDIKLYNTQNADILVLAGDICVARDLGQQFVKDGQGNVVDSFYLERGVRTIEFFRRVCQEFPHVIYIMGNHEHYHGDFAKTYEKLTKKFAALTNLHIMDKESFQYKDVTFIGGTMWTNMNKNDESLYFRISKMMNDFQCVKDSGKVIHFKVMDENGVFKDHTRPGTFLPADAAWDHELFIKFATKQLDFLKDQKVVMVTHHAPTFRSIDPAYAHDTVMNYAYASDLSEFILDHPQIKIWIHGHMHHRQEYCVGETIVTSNPRGYVRHQRSADTFEIEYIEV